MMYINFQVILCKNYEMYERVGIWSYTYRIRIAILFKYHENDCIFYTVNIFKNISINQYFSVQWREFMCTMFSM